MSTKKGKMKTQLRIFNIILIALSALSIVWLAVFPFIKVNVNYKITADMVKEVMQDMDENVDVDDIVGDGIDIKLSVAITPKMLLKSFTESDTREYVKEDVIAPIVDNLIEELKPTIEEIARRAVKSAAKKQLTVQLQDSFREAFGENVDVEAKLAEAGINVDEVIDIVFDAFMAEDAVFNSNDPENPGVVQILLEQVNEVGASTYEYFFSDDESKTWEDISLDDPDVADAIDQVEDTLKELGLIDEEGKILDFDTMLGTLLDKFMNSDSGSDIHEAEYHEENEIESTGVIDPLNRVYAEEASEEELTEEESAEAEEKAETLTDKIKELIYEKLPDGIEDTISLVLKAVGGVLGLFLFTWAFVGLFALLKTLFAENPGIFTGLICFISAILQLVIGLVLTFGVSYVLSGNLNIDVVSQALKEIPEGLTIAITSSATIPAFCVLAKFVLTWFYHPVKRKLKKRLDLD